MGRQPCCEKVGLKRGPWTIEEDNKLMTFILSNGIQCWRLVPKLAGLKRCGKSCRLRWINYLRPDLKRGAFTEAEEDMIIELHSRLGNRWSKIAAHFPGRTDNEIKNHWNTRIKKKMKLLGLDPLTHQPINQQEESIQNSATISEEPMQQKQEFQAPEFNDYQNIEGSLVISGPHQDRNDQPCYKSLEMASSIMLQNVEPIGSFPSMDPFQSWVDNPLLWDGFGNLEHNFP